MSDISIADTAISNDADLEWMRQIQTQQRRCDEENGVLRNIFKRAKADGRNVASMRRAIKATKREPGEVIADLRAEIRYMALRRIPLTQAELFAGFDLHLAEKSEHEDDLWSADDAGYRAGWGGVPIDDDPHAAGSEADVHWRAGWHKGQAARARQLGPDATQATASRTRPQRSAQARLAGTERVQKASDKLSNKTAARQTKPKKVNGRAIRRRRRSATAENGAPLY
jgi:hypothetical protein